MSEATNDAGGGNYCEWLWDASSAARSLATSVADAGREAKFHLEYSSGTAAIRGTKAFSEGHHYWEILMQSAVYGTDMMIGLGTAAVQMDKYRNQFCSFLGIDEESWGLSYTGLLHHGGKSQCYTNKFSQGTIIGLHLDMWRGTLTFYKNKQNLGIAYHGLQGKAVYPMVCSTAARSSMKILHAVYFPSSLQFLCCEIIRRIVPKQLDVTEVMAMPPGLRNFLHNNLYWLLQPCDNSLDRRHENLDKANSLIDRVRATLEVNERLNDQGNQTPDSYDECCDGVTEFSLHCDDDDDDENDDDDDEGDDDPSSSSTAIFPDLLETGNRKRGVRDVESTRYQKDRKNSTIFRKSFKTADVRNDPWIQTDIVSDGPQKTRPDTDNKQCFVKKYAADDVKTSLSRSSMLKMLSTTNPRTTSSLSTPTGEERRLSRGSNASDGTKSQEDESRNIDRIHIPLSANSEKTESSDGEFKADDMYDDFTILSDSSSSSSSSSRDDSDSLPSLDQPHD